LRGVSWGTYENLLSDHVDASAPRFTFDQGVLEIMSPSSEPEEYNRALALLVEVLAEELHMDIRNLGSTTFKRGICSAASKRIRPSTFRPRSG